SEITNTPANIIRFIISKIIDSPSGVSARKSRKYSNASEESSRDKRMCISHFLKTRFSSRQTN
ncbi:MAG TPA: hypothetical protein PLU50_04005, partial [Pseudobdellovibrionaceae bacterium]|nr:hypothetical protein [Pseudobdellovibrionaceae bacterium]